MIVFIIFYIKKKKKIIRRIYQLNQKLAARLVVGDLQVIIESKMSID